MQFSGLREPGESAGCCANRVEAKLAESKFRVAVLGCGMVGGFIARTLAADGGFEVEAYDAGEIAVRNLLDSAERLGGADNLSATIADLSDPAAISAAVADCDAAVGALPGFLGYAALKAVIEAGKNCVDISFFPVDVYSLAELARSKGVIAVTDCGVMPGFGGMTAVRFAGRLDVCDSVRIMVGGLPESRTGAFEYKAPFSPIDVIEEYLRPARMRVGGVLLTKPALSDVESVDFPEVGTLEAFNTDGLRTLLATMPEVPSLVEKTLRYPGHAEKIAFLRDAGFFGTERITLGRAEDGTHYSLAPLEMTARLLMEQWKPVPGEREFTVMRVEARGSKDGAPAKMAMNLLDRTCILTGDSSMARTTGLPAVAAVRMISDGSIAADGALCSLGIVPAELIGKNGKFYDRVLDTLAQSGVEVEFDGSPND